jgi:DEAD/DEAH box helicase domain-containing protein
MLPAVLASQLSKGIGDYTKTLFPITNILFRNAMDRMIHEGLFHEPFVSVRLPFRVSDKQLDGFTAIHQQFPPYVHQQKAFDRLVGSDARSTLIATGTGSGKTECFLYPILEYCYQNRGLQGVKALIIYPMNSLATDQAKRLAQLIGTNSELKGNVTAGMYVGGHVDHAVTVMTPNSIITDHDAMLANPPDILLTNYKMLDYLLVRPKDAVLWRNNDPETLKFIVVDELHTFDGAQGTDLACLLRRLKSRLYTPQGSLCCIGTSATMGSPNETHNILDYAKNIFGEQFEDDAIITEDRLSAAEFLMNYDISDYTIPDDVQIKKMEAATADTDPQEYLRLAADSWLDGSFQKDKMFSANGQIELGEHLRHHNLFCTLLQLVQNKFISYNDILEQLQERYPVIVSWPDKNAGLEALLSLISYARVKDNSGNLRPFLFVQVQLWLRELRRLVAKVDDKNVDFAISLDLNALQIKHYLPVVNCRECGATGWATYYTPTIRSAEISSLENFYSAYFGHDSNIHILYPCEENQANMELCPDCMHLQAKQSTEHKCEVCQHHTIFVNVPLLEHKYGQFICPCCHSSRGLSIMGLRGATEISSGLSLLYASRFNNDKKLLAFSDNVQDAALRAGFFNARTWHVCLRMAIQEYLSSRGNNLPLYDFAEQFPEFWRKKLASDEKYVSLLLPTNLQWLRAYEHMIATGTLPVDTVNIHDRKRIINLMQRRLAYEIFYEYGRRSEIGMTLCKSLCSTINFNLITLDKAAEEILHEAQETIGELRNIGIDNIKNIIAGFLYHLKCDGALSNMLNDVFAVTGKRFVILGKNAQKISINPWIPDSLSHNLPSFLSEIPNERNGFIALADTKSWYTKWLTKYTEQINPYIRRLDLETDLLRIIVTVLPKYNVLHAYKDKGNKIISWGINSHAVNVTDKVVRLTCDNCGRSITVAYSDIPYWEDCHCLNTDCQGKLKIDISTSADNYYSKLYNTGNLVRIFAREHTGLLAREDREKLEADFKQSGSTRKPWNPNLLSCTPTLEMGIDIGDLSTVVLCSVPPGQSQYIQRVGRAGRKDGNSLALTVANSQPHDLYFYGEPLSMLQGAIIPPKVFLRASAVLERQFTAFAMDTWVNSVLQRQEKPDILVPRNMATCLANMKTRSDKIFPFNLVNCQVKCNVLEK